MKEVGMDLTLELDIDEYDLTNINTKNLVISLWTNQVSGVTIGSVG